MSERSLALAIPHLGVYGGIRRFLELGEVWSKRGHRVGIFIPEGAGTRPWLPFSGEIRSMRELPLGGWDTVISPDPSLFLDARCPGALRVYYSVLEGAPEEARACRAANLVLANSAGMRRYLARRGVEASDAAGGVNPSQFHPGPRAPRDRVRVLIYGRLSRTRKGTWIAVQALERAVKETGVPVELTLFDAPPDGRVPQLPSPLDLPHRWVLDPSQEELAALYRDSDLFIAAERRAGWCNTAAEAMASGATVVCTRSGSEDFAIDQVTAAVPRWRWSWAMARAIAPLLRDPARRAALAARGLAKIQEFSWERTADRIDRALEARQEGRTHGQGAARAAL